MIELVVLNASRITGRGTVVFFEGKPYPHPGSIVEVQVKKPDGSSFTATAQVELARRLPPGEVPVLFFKNMEPSEFPIGSHVSIP